MPQTTTATIPHPDDAVAAGQAPAAAPADAPVHRRPVYHPHPITPESAGTNWGARVVVLIIVLTAVGFGGYGLWQWRQNWLANHITWVSPPLTTPGLPVAGLDFTCTLVEDGRMMCWGSNEVGQLGDTSPVRTGQPNTVLAAGITQFDAGDRHICARQQDGTVLCWGSNFLGQLGRPTTAMCRTEHGNLKCAVIPQPSPVTNAVSVSAGVEHTCTLNADSTITCWGNNHRGQLGVAQFPETTMVSQPAGSLRFASLTAGGYHTCGLLPNGVAMCWGWNVYGQLATRTRAEMCGPSPSRQTPCNPQPVATAPALRFSSIVTGREHTCAIAQDGKSWCWGANNHGELGIGRAGASTPNPQIVTGNHTFTSLGAGESFTCGLANDGKVWCWGSAVYHQLGTTDSTLNGTPVQVPVPDSVASIGVGPRHACATTAERRIYCWGSGDAGQTGNVRLINNPYLREAGPPANAR